MGGQRGKWAGGQLPTCLLSVSCSGVCLDFQQVLSQFWLLSGEVTFAIQPLLVYVFSHPPNCMYIEI